MNNDTAAIVDAVNCHWKDSGLQNETSTTAKDTNY